VIGRGGYVPTSSAVSLIGLPETLVELLEVQIRVRAPMRLTLL
jgi:hypothetical protein